MSGTSGSWWLLQQCEFSKVCWWLARTQPLIILVASPKSHKKPYLFLGMPWGEPSSLCLSMGGSLKKGLEFVLDLRIAKVGAYDFFWLHLHKSANDHRQQWHQKLNAARGSFTRSAHRTTCAPGSGKDNSDTVRASSSLFPHATWSWMPPNCCHGSRLGSCWWWQCS